jgi:hypothetical protein
MIKALEYHTKFTRILAKFCSFRAKCQPAHFRHLKLSTKMYIYAHEGKTVSEAFRTRLWDSFVNYHPTDSDGI